MIPIVITILILYIGVNSWLYYKIIQLLQPSPLIVKVILSVLYWILAFSFFIIQLFRDKEISPLIYSVLYKISTSWLIIILYITLLYGVISVIRLFGLHVHHDFMYCIIITTLLLIYGNYNFKHPKVRHLHIDLQENKELAQKIRVVAVSDIHLGYGINRKKLERYVDLINKEDPDIVLIGGDLTDTTISPLLSDRMYEPLQQLRTSFGVYMVAGNHDYMSGINEVIEFTKRANITLLRDTIAVLPCGVQIIGHDDKSNSDRKSAKELIGEADSKKPIIFLDHQPDNSVIEDVSTTVTDFAFFGHTHHGQFFPINIVTDFIYSLSYGYRVENNTYLYVSSGLGLWGPPFRIGSDSEILVVDIL